MTQDCEQPRPDFAQEVFHQYGRPLHRFLARRLRRPQDADDLAQEVFIRLARLEKPELVRKPQAYLFSLAFNLIREFRLRSEKEQAQLTYDSAAAEEAAEKDENAARDELGEQLNLRLQLESALEQLPPIHRAVLLLIKRDGWSHKEVARRTGLNVRVVERYLIEAKARMLTMEWDR